MIYINLLPAEDTPRSRSLKLPKVGAMVPVAAAAAVLLLCTTMFFVQQRKIDDLGREVEVAKEESRRLAPQIARIAQLPIGTVKNRIFRAREMLKRDLADVLDSRV